MTYLILKWVHILSAILLLGTGLDWDYKWKRFLKKWNLILSMSLWRASRFVKNVMTILISSPQSIRSILMNGIWIRRSELKMQGE